MMLEICVEDLAGLRAAAAGGADRIELCSALALGGLTPPASLVQAAAAAAGLPVHLLARPREGDFCYDAADIALVAQDITLAAQAGLAGVVIGASTPGRELDTATLAAWADHARAASGGRLSLTLHRAFDLCPDLDRALEMAVALGFDRILTSGGAPRAIDALDRLRSLWRRAAGRIMIMAGSGIEPANVAAIMAAGVDEIHASCRREVPGDDGAERRFGFAAGPRRIADAKAVAALRSAMQQTDATKI